MAALTHTMHRMTTVPANAHAAGHQSACRSVSPAPAAISTMARPWDLGTAGHTGFTPKPDAHPRSFRSRST